MFEDSNDKKSDDFWNLDEYIAKKRSSANSAYRVNSAKSVSAVEIDVDFQKSEKTTFSDSKLSNANKSSINDNDSSNTITRFIPPHRDEIFSKKNLLYEYTSQNPLIKSVKVFSSKKDDELFPKSNLFIRERAALIDRNATECPYVSYYSFSPRYSQMSRGQLKWYLWWRTNIRNGIYLKTDESYVTLYVYELAAVDSKEDAEKSVDSLCALLNNYSVKDIGVISRMVIRDTVCDLCVMYDLPSPISKISDNDHVIFFNSFLPEVFIDLSQKDGNGISKYCISSLSMYDYRKSKYYTDETKAIFNKAIADVIIEIFNDARSFEEITAFASGKYSCITAERRPFSRMVNIVNKEIKYEIKYYQLSSIQSGITDVIRYSENRIRDHLGIKNKLHILAVNPVLKSVVDRFFDRFYPAKPIIDRRRTPKSIPDEQVPHDYDRFYDVPNIEISAERAIEIERLSWNTTKILTEAFSCEDDSVTLESRENSTTENTLFKIESANEISTVQEAIYKEEGNIVENSSQGGLLDEIKAKIGRIADFLLLCKDGSVMEQRKFASSSAVSLDEIADEINEAAVDIFGDILLESTPNGYRILEDYKDEI